MERHNFTFKEAKEKIDMVDYLASLGFCPARAPKGNEHWYRSPFMPGGDSDPSFKVDRVRGGQVWYDHANGCGGDLVAFGIKYHACGYGEMLQRLRAFLSIPPGQKTFFKSRQLAQPVRGNDEEKDKRITVIAERPIYQFYLKSYLRERCIPLGLANQFLKEIDYLNNGRQYTALGFKNDKGGFEIRAKNFKGSCSPKAPTLVKNISPGEEKHKPQNEQSIAVVEGFFSFLSYLQLSFHNQFPLPRPDNFLVLNSLSFFQGSFEQMERFGEKMLFLDNDAAGDRHTTMALVRNGSLNGPGYSDNRHPYKGHNDLNKFLVALVRPRQEKDVGASLKASR